MLDYARATGNGALAQLVTIKARGFYENDIDYPVRYEPSGNDFFSAGLNEADLMRRVLSGKEFGKWLDGLFPGLKDGEMGNLRKPVRICRISATARSIPSAHPRANPCARSSSAKGRGEVQPAGSGPA